MSILEQMGEWVTAKREDSPAPRLRLLLADHLLDTVGAWIAGRATEEGEKLARLASQPNSPISLLGRHPLDRLALAVATTRLTEIDDIHMASCTTPSSVVVPAALVTAGQFPKCESRVFVEALLAGYEVMTRFGTAIAGPKILSRGVWPTYFTAPVCAAAVTARMLSLNAAQSANALAIALTMAANSPGRPQGASPRWLLLGMAARAGCAAALAAADGYAGDLSLLDGDWLARAHCVSSDSAPLVGSLDADSAICELSLKPYCAAKQTIAAIDAFRELLARGLSSDDMVNVRVAVPPAYAEMIGHRNASAARMGRITSAPYQLALAAYRPRELENVARPNLTADPEITAFLGRVEVVADESLAEHFPRRWPARIEALLKDGRAETSLVLDATGDPPRHFEFDVRAKFHRLADPVIGAAAAKELADACLHAPERTEALEKLCEKMN